MAISHAVKTMQDHVRPDGSTFHVVDYNTDGTVFSKFTAQGAGANTTWSRGQAWGLNGFTMVYRYTQDARFLATAQQLADYFINNLPPDFVPYWDFSQSGTAPRDSSAAAIAAAGLLDLSKYVALPADSTRYRTPRSTFFPRFPLLPTSVTASPPTASCCTGPPISLEIPAWTLR